MKRIVYRFRSCSVDPTLREFHRRGNLVSLSPKAFDALVYLIEHRDRAVGRDELAAAVFARTDVTDVALKHLIRKLRHAVDSDENNETAIRTIPRFGVRWVVATESVELHDVPVVAVTQEALPQPSGFYHWRLFAIAAIAILVFVGSFLWITRKYEPAAAVEKVAAPSAAQSAEVVAVLPVDTTSLSKDDSWMSIGLMELMASRIRSASTTVVSSSDIVALAKEHQTQDALLASVRSTTNVVNIVTSRLVRTTEGWEVNVTILGRDKSTLTVAARSTDALLAVREAADRVLARLGKTPPSTDTSVVATELRVEAALLAGNLPEANSAIQSASSELRETHEGELLILRVARKSGSTEGLHERLEDLLRRTTPESDPVLRANVLNELATLERDDTTRWDEARMHCDESISLVQNANQPRLLGRAHALRGVISSVQARFDEAQADFAQARIAFGLAGDSLELAKIDMLEGALEGMRGHPAQSLLLSENAALRFRQFNDRPSLANALGNVMTAQLELLRPTEALVTSEQIKAETEVMSATSRTRFARLQQVAALIDSGHLSTARALLNSLEPTSDTQDIGVDNAYKAQLDFQAGRWDSASRFAEEAISGLEATDSDDVRGAAWLLNVRALRAMGRNAEARAEIQRLYEWSHQVETPKKLMRARLADAEQAWADGQPDRARTLFEQAMHTAHEQAIPSDIADVATSYGTALIEAGELEKAVAVAGRLSSWADTDYDSAILLARLHKALGHEGSAQVALAQASSLAGERSLPAALSILPAKPN